MKHTTTLLHTTSKNLFNYSPLFLLSIFSLFFLSTTIPFTVAPQITSLSHQFSNLLPWPDKMTDSNCKFTDPLISPLNKQKMILIPSERLQNTACLRVVLLNTTNAAVLLLTSYLTLLVHHNWHHICIPFPVMLTQMGSQAQNAGLSMTLWVEWGIRWSPVPANFCPNCPRDSTIPKFCARFPGF